MTAIVHATRTSMSLPELDEAERRLHLMPTRKRSRLTGAFVDSARELYDQGADTMHAMDEAFDRVMRPALLG
jgi:hypothetical protein